MSHPPCMSLWAEVVLAMAEISWASPGITLMLSSCELADETQCLLGWQALFHIVSVFQLASQAQERRRNIAAICWIHQMKSIFRLTLFWNISCHLDIWNGLISFQCCCSTKLISTYQAEQSLQHLRKVFASPQLSAVQWPPISEKPRIFKTFIFKTLHETWKHLICPPHLPTLPLHGTLFLCYWPANGAWVAQDLRHTLCSQCAVCTF